MAVGAFPLAKLGFLVIKQVSKPIANALARRAKSSRLFRDYVCIPVAQLFHWYDVRVRMRILNLGKATTVPKLNEDKAIETGSQLLSEFIIMSIASSVIIYEWRRSAEKEEAKQAEAQRERELLGDKVMSMEIAIEEQRTQIRELTRLSHSLIEKQGQRKTSGSAQKSFTGLFSSTAKENDEAPTVKDVSSAVEDGEDVEEGVVTGAVSDVLKLVGGSQAGGGELSIQASRPRWWSEEGHGHHYLLADDDDGGEADGGLYRPGTVLEAIQYFLDTCSGSSEL